MAGRKKRGLPWAKCQTILVNHVTGEERACGATAAFRESRRCAPHATKAVDRLLTIVEGAIEDGADLITATICLPVITSEMAELELSPEDWELELVAGRLLLRQAPQLLAAITTEPKEPA